MSILIQFIIIQINLDLIKITAIGVSIYAVNEEIIDKRLKNADNAVYFVKEMRVTNFVHLMRPS